MATKPRNVNETGIDLLRAARRRSKGSPAYHAAIFRDYQRHYENGEREYLAMAISHCAFHGLRLPDWACVELLDGRGRRLLWREVLGREVPDNRDRDSFLKEQQISLAIHAEVKRARRNGNSINSALARVAKRHGVGRTLVRQVYRQSQLALDITYPPKSPDSPAPALQTLLRKRWQR
jgi:hypothetical protein